MRKWVSCIIVTVRKGIWVPLTVFIVHEVFAHIHGNLYDLYPSLDIPMHFAGGGAIAYFSSVFIRQMEEKKFLVVRSEIVAMIFIFAFTATAATFWEYAEWISDHTFGTQAQKGLDDTLLDIVVGLSGGVMFLLMFQRNHRAGK